MKIRDWRHAEELVKSKDLQNPPTLDDVLEFVKGKTGKTTEQIFAELAEYEAIIKEKRENTKPPKQMTTENLGKLYANYHRLERHYENIRRTTDFK